MPAPAPQACLMTPYSAKPGQKGGTLISEDVVTLEAHRARLVDPDGYRPERCEHCGLHRLHAHDFRTRVLRGDPETPAELIRRYLCPACCAVWRVLPAFIARRLHRRWAVVQAVVTSCGAVAATGAEPQVSVPARTADRWAGRLCATAILLTQLLAAAGHQVVEVLGTTGTACSRAELVDALAAAGLVEPARKLEQLAGWVHRLAPGVRLM